MVALQPSQHLRLAKPLYFQSMLNARSLIGGSPAPPHLTVGAEGAPA
jgi:hypothetical protein